MLYVHTVSTELYSVCNLSLIPLSKLTDFVQCTIQFQTHKPMCDVGLSSNMEKEVVDDELGCDANNVRFGSSANDSVRSRNMTQ